VAITRTPNQERDEYWNGEEATRACALAAVADALNARIAGHGVELGSRAWLVSGRKTATAGPP
jgi:hypothetical protein